jgi:isochorismate pyruvate lyase
MTTFIKVPHCTSMTELRAHIDSLDDQIAALIAERSAFVAQAARIKSNPEQIVDNARIEFIIGRVREKARSAGAPEPVMEATYRAMIAAFIEFERKEFMRLREEPAS